jgi:hypothetical protein
MMVAATAGCRGMAASSRSAGISDAVTLVTASARVSYVAPPASAGAPNQSPGPRISKSRTARCLEPGVDSRMRTCPAWRRYRLAAGRVRLVDGPPGGTSNRRAAKSASATSSATTAIGLAAGAPAPAGSAADATAD